MQRMSNGVVFPDVCPQCRHAQFEHVGFGMWHGKGVGGVFQKARCLACDAVWFGSQTETPDGTWGEATWVRCDWEAAASPKPASE